jgi:hypothetical protein
VVKSYCGHGIGDLFHCAPNIPHYAHNKAVGVMKEGMVRAGAARVRRWRRVRGPPPAPPARTPMSACACLS